MKMLARQSIAYTLKLTSTFLFTIVSILAIAQNNCQLKEDSDGVKVYSCKVEGQPFNSVKATFEVNATADEYVTFIFDVDNYVNWKYKTSSARLINRISDSEQLFYMTVDSPWPVTDRDLVIRLKVKKDPANHQTHITLISENGIYPEQKGFVRIKKSITTLTLTENSKGTLDANWALEVNPGGEIPAWIANMFATQGPIETFKLAKENLAERKSMGRK